MGSFYATCSITDLSIVDGNDTYMQLIIPTWVRNPHSIDGEQIGCGEKGLRVSNEGAMGEFVPFGFPILGKYADYGDIDEIVRDDNVLMLEEFFGISIEDILSCATDDRWYGYGYKPVVEDKTKEEYEGQHASWIVGDNKMKHVEILKAITVTYFRKEHYDYLSSDFHGDDNYWMEESKKRAKKLKKSLKTLGERHSDKPDKPKRTVDSIDDKMVANYRECFNHDGMTDEEIKKDLVAILNHSTNKKLDGIERDFPIVSIAKTNMYELLPLNEKFYDYVVKQFRFMINMHSLYKVLRPSYYGSQQNNFGSYAKFHIMSVNLANKDLVADEKRNGLWIIEDVLDSDETLEKISDKDKDLMFKALEKAFKAQGYE